MTSRSSLFLLLLLVTSGCLDPGPPPEVLEVDRPPIVGGTREPDEPAVVFIMHNSGGGCSASVIAPRVVLTAKHCVINLGTGAVLPARGFHVFVGPSVYRIIDEYRVTEVRPTAGVELSDADIALLILDRDFAHGAKRWEFTPWPGVEHDAVITAIGYGQTRYDVPETAGTKYRRDGRVVELGPNARWRLGALEFMTEGENTCQGDSGGPILFQDVVVGIVSRGEDGCTGYGWVTRVSSHAEMILQALRDTGACVPTGFEACNRLDDDCWNGVDDGIEATCACSGGAEPSVEICDGRDNDCNAAIDDLPACGCTGGASPGAEVCDLVDNDCNGQIDEVCQHLGDPCGTDAECSTGRCADLDGAMVCTAGCVSGLDECPEGGWCDGPACGEGTCRPGRGDRPPGQPCDGHEDCATGFCVTAEGRGAVCARPCAPAALECLAVEVCAGLAEGCGACLTPHGHEEGLTFGEPCAADSDCASGMCFTDGDPEACGDGCTVRYCAQPCGDDGWCPDGAHCREGTCVRGPRSPLGGTCVRDADCLEGWCAWRDGVGRCVTGCGEGGTCSPGSWCVDGSFCWPEGRRAGDPCDPGGEPCAEGECVTISGQPVCAFPCSDAGDCPSGMSCVPDDDTGRAWCGPATIPVVIENEIETGCQCRAGARPVARHLAVPFAVLIIALVIRSRRG